MFVSGLSVYFAGAWKVAILLTDEAGFPRNWTCVVACRNVGVLHGRLAEPTKGREGGARSSVRVLAIVSDVHFVYRDLSLLGQFTDLRRSSFCQYTDEIMDAGVYCCGGVYGNWLH